MPIKILGDIVQITKLWVKLTTISSRHFFASPTTRTHGYQGHIDQIGKKTYAIVSGRSKFWKSPVFVPHQEVGLPLIGNFGDWSKL